MQLQNNNQKEAYSLITGASAGIGKEMAKICASKGYNVLLVALPATGLEKLEYLTKTYQVKVIFLELDLLHENAPSQLYEFCINRKLKINMLINNAGIGGRIRFDESRFSEVAKMIHLNIKTVSEITHLFIPLLKEHPRSYILNVSSTAAFFTIPEKAVYSSTKAFINAFTSGLRKELRSFGVTVSLLCPGGSSHSVDEVVKSCFNNYFVNLIHESPPAIAEAGIEGLLKGKKVILPGIVSKFYVLASRLLPSSLLDIIVNSIFISRSEQKSQDTFQLKLNKSASEGVGCFDLESKRFISNTLSYPEAASRNSNK